MSATGEGGLLEVKAVAVLLGLADETVRSRAKDGSLPTAAVDPLRFSPTEVKAAKVLLESACVDGSKHRIPRPQFVAARAAGVIAPDNGKYSLNDIAEAKRWIAEGCFPGPIAQPSPPPPGAPVSVGAGPREAALRRYLVDGSSPSSLPDHYWLTSRPPPYVAPRDAYRAVVHSFEPRFRTDGSAVRRHVCTEVFAWRSGYYTLRGDELAWVDPRRVVLRREPDDRSPVEPGQVPAELREATMRWQEGRIEWQLAWEQRAHIRRARRAETGGEELPITTGVPTREAILDDYHRFMERPRDLPPEFWYGQTRPRFEPPTDVARRRLGDRIADRLGRPFTQILCAGHWATIALGTEGVQWIDERVEDLWIGHDVSEDDPRLVALNRPYEEAEREWNEASRDFESWEARIAAGSSP